MRYSRYYRVVMRVWGSSDARRRYYTQQVLRGEQGFVFVDLLTLIRCIMYS